MRRYPRFGRSRDEGVGCQYPFCEGRKETDWEGSGGGEYEACRRLLEGEGGVEGCGIDGFREGARGVGC